MAQSYVTFTGNGSSTGPITLGFNYILKAHVKVYQTRDILANTGTLLSETTHYTFNGAGTQISMVTAPANGVVITIERQTPNDDQIVPYEDGSNLIADSLNNSDKQTLFCTQELEDRQALSAAKADAAKTSADTATSNVATLTSTQFRSDGTQAMSGNLDAGNNHVRNVADPTAAQDAVTKAYLERTGSIASAQILDGTIVDGDVNASAAISGSKLQASSGSNAGSMSSAHYTKIEGIEASATADQTSSEIKSSYESNSDTNAYTDAEKTKLSGIESSATADQSASEIKSSYESNSNTNAFTDANKTLVDAISATATEINHTTNVTSDIQSQINNKQPLDSELTTLSGMTSATASKLAASTNLTSDIADLNQVDGLTKQTTISDSDASFPTSGAVVDYVAAQIAPLGGLEVVATEVAFPNTQPSSGVVISISDAGGVVVNGSGVSTTGRTVGGSTVTINNFPSSLHSETLAAGVGLMVSSTGSSQTYNYHKILGKEDDIKQLSDDINDFAARYRVGSSNPTSSLDAGDLFFNTGTNKLLVYNATNTAWEEAQSIGNFYISTFSESFDGSRTDFTLSNAPTNAQQVIISINGVIQKPNAGTSTPSEGFALDGSTVKLSNAPASGSSYFAYVLGSTVNIGTPSNNTVSTAIIQNGAVTGEKIATNLDLTDNKKIRFGTGNDFQIVHDGTDSYLDHSLGSGLLRINAAGGAEIRLTKSGPETLARFIPDAGVELYYDNSKKLETASDKINFHAHAKVNADNTYDLGASGARWKDLFISNDIDIIDNGKLLLGTGDDLQIYHDGLNSYIEDSGAGALRFKTNEFAVYNAAGSEWLFKAEENGPNLLKYDGATKLATAAGGVRVTGNLLLDADNQYIKLGAGDDLQIYHDGSHSWIKNSTGNLYINGKGGEVHIAMVPDAGVELRYNDEQQCETKANGFEIKTAGDTDSELTVTGPENRAAIINMQADDGDDNGDIFRLVVSTSSDFYLQNYAGGSYETNIKAVGNGSTELYYDGVLKIATESSGGKVEGNWTLRKITGGDSSGVSSENLLFNTQSGDIGKINCVSQGGGGPSGHGGAMRFYTKPNNNSTLAERMSINVDGDVFIQRVYDNTTSGGGNVRVQSNGLLQRDTSSRRYKNTIEDATHGLADLNKLRSVTYKGNNDGDTIFGGLIAEEVDDAGLTEFVDYNSDNEPDALRYGNMVALCIKAIQELSTEVETLKTKVAALESA